MTCISTIKSYIPDYHPHTTHSRILFMIPVIGTLFFYAKEEQLSKTNDIFRMKRLEPLIHEGRLWGAAQIIAGIALLILFSANTLGLLACGISVTSYTFMWLPLHKNEPSRNNAH